MNKQKRMLELLAIMAFIIILCTIIWKSNPYSPSAQSTVSKIDSGLTQVNHDHTQPVDSNWAEGKTLFKSNCAICHNPTVAQTGPALIGVTKRWEDAGSYQGKTGKQWLYTWIKNWNEVVSAKYPYAVAVKNSYNQSPMNTFPNLTDEKIDKILKYVEAPDGVVPTHPVAIK